MTKADGSKQLFSREKVALTCLRMGADREVADRIALQVERHLYEGIPTGRILQLIFSLMRKPKPAVGHLYDLRRGISLMEPKPEFEAFVRVLLGYSGFEVKPNVMLRGLCGEHEADAIATKNGVTYLVEAKHHFAYHALTGLDESRIARAIIEDVTEGYIRGVTDLKIDCAMIVTNTRYSEHARNYGGCRGILQVGWESPDGFGLRETVEKHRLYPLSCLRGLDRQTRLRLVSIGIVLIRQLLEQDCSYLERRIGLSCAAAEALMEKARHTTETLWQPTPRP
ncbi:MAG: restriction endonuclease [Candidatus Bathyarchaeota archaeon]|nr:restriction endonuclease [Candidatus Bathyarchaeota archaeon]